MSAESTRSSLGALGLVGALLLGFALLPRVFHRQAHDAPDFALPVVTNAASLGSGGGATLALRDLRGSAVLLDFWATWCGPCRTEAPIVDRVARRWRDKGVVVVGVNEDKPDEGDPAAFAREAGLSYPIVRDGAGRTMHDYEADSLPTLVVISPGGKVTAVRSGLTDDAEIERLLRQAMQPEAKAGVPAALGL